MPSVTDLLAQNRANWDERTALHLEAYGIERFLAGESALGSLERREMGDVGGHSLLHLQCHFGLDTLFFASLDWALRTSARVVIVMTHPAFRQPRHSGWQ